MDVPFDVIWTDEFKIAWGKLTYELEDAGLDVQDSDDRIETAIKALEESGPGVLDPYKPGRSQFAVPIDEQYLLVVRWSTDCDGEGRHVRHHLELWDIQRSPLAKKIKEKA
jgi:hypothetical protein